MRTITNLLLTLLLTLPAWAASSSLDGEVFVAAGTTGTNALPSSRTTNVTISAHSNVGATDTAFVFDTSVTHTSGTLVEFYNQGTNAVSIAPKGGVYIANGQDYNGGTTDTDLLVGIHSVDRGDEADWNFFLGSVETSSFANAISQFYIYGEVAGNDTLTETYTEAFNSDQSLSGSWRNAAGVRGNSYFRYANQGGIYLQLKPDAASDPYVFDSTNGVTGNILQVLSGGSARFSVNPVGKATAVQGFSSTATDAAVTIDATGWTNTFTKNAVVYMDGTGLTFTVYNNALTPVYTNSVTLTGASVLLQPAGKVIITAGTLGVGRATPF